jgi:phage terminase small subunit
MLALNERKRAFILHYLVQGCTNGAEASQAAGYSDEAGGAKVRAHELLHQDAVLDALRKQASKNLRDLFAVAIMKLEQIVLKDGSPDQLKSILAVLNRTGSPSAPRVDRRAACSRRASRWGGAPHRLRPPPSGAPAPEPRGDDPRDIR